MKNQKNKNGPLSSAVKLLNWFCKDSLIEEIEGDLFEKYSQRVNKFSKFKNDLLFLFEVLSFFRPIIIRNDLFNINFLRVNMLTINIKFALRNLYKNFFFSTINISGLAAGIACVLFIFFYVQNELSYDSFNENVDRIYRAGIDASFNGHETKSVETGGRVGPLSMEIFPEVESFTRIDYWGMGFIRYEDKTFKENNIISADSNFFEIFSIPVLVGNSGNVLNQPDYVVISKKAANKYFGSKNPVGKKLIFNEEDIYNVSGVFENFPNNFHIKSDFIFSHSFREDINQELYSIEKNYFTYLLLKRNANADELLSKFTPTMETKFEEEVQAKGWGDSREKNPNSYWRYILHKLSDVHFKSEYWSRLNKANSMEYIYIFSAIAIFILLIASINFINLSTAKSSSRSKEIGIKKVLGSFKSNLIAQFLTESVIISLISLVLAFLLVELAKPIFFDVIGKEFELSYLNNVGFGVAILGIVFLVGLVAGSFPAFVLSSFSPISVLKGNLTNIMKKSWFRSTLVVFQFSASIILIIGTVVIFKQLDFMQNKNLGFDKEQILIIDDAKFLGDKSEIFKESMLNHPNVLKGTISGFLPVESHRKMNGGFRDANKEDPNVGPVQWWTVDYDYFETLGIKLLKGRNFSKDHSTDTEALIITKAALEYAGWEDDALNHSLGHLVDNFTIKEYKIIGVVDNFHFYTPKYKINPVVFVLGNHSGNISFKVTGNIPEVLEFAEELWKELLPKQPFAYRFMDEAFNKEFRSELNLLSLFRYFAIIAVLIACLGLFGLSAYTAERKTKEIGIRKIHGARVYGLIILLSKEFTKLVFIAILISSPIGYYLMNKWLNDYALRINIGADTFILTALVSLAIALLTVGFHAVKVSLANPINTLRNE